MSEVVTGGGRGARHPEKAVLGATKVGKSPLFCKHSLNFFVGRCK